jgi:hypothetical protein
VIVEGLGVSSASEFLACFRGYLEILALLKSPVVRLGFSVFGKEVLGFSNSPSRVKSVSFQFPFYFLLFFW